MAADADRYLFPRLRRLYLNRKLHEIDRGDLELFQTPLSARWLPALDEPSMNRDWENARNWQSILHGITRTSAIIFGARHCKLVFDDKNSASYLYPDKDIMVISMEPVKRPMPGFTIYDAVDTMTGQVIHQTAHLRERQVTPVDPLQDTAYDSEILSFLRHLAEDVVIDQIISLQYPGFEGYLLKYRRYLFDWTLRGLWKTQVEGRLKQFILSMRSTIPVQMNRSSVRNANLYFLYVLSRNRSIEQLRRINRDELARQLYMILYDAGHAAHWREPDVLSESFVLGLEGPPVAGEKGKNRGGRAHETSVPISRQSIQQLDPQTLEWINDKAQPLFDKAAVEIAGDRTIGSKKWFEEFSHLRVPNVNEQVLSQKQIGLMRRMEEDRLTLLDGKNNRYDYRVYLSEQPLYTLASKRYDEAVNAIRGQIEYLRKQLAWANAPIHRDRIALHSGDLDEEALYRAKFAADLFRKPDFIWQGMDKLDFVLLIDASRSMKQPMEGSAVPKYVAAQRLAALFVEAFERIKFVHTWVFSYSSLEHDVDLRLLFSPGKDANRARIGDLSPTHQTPEYEALLAVSSHINKIARADARKIYVVISDGNPEDDVMPPERQKSEIKRLVRRLHANGDTVIHVALSSKMRDEGGYPNRLRFPEQGYPELVRRFGKMLMEQAASIHSL